MIDIGLLSSTKYNDGGALEAQVLLHGAGSSCTPGLAYSPFGFKGRPRGPKMDAQGNVLDAALVLYWYEGNTLHTLPLDDGRRSTTLPKLAEGCSIFYADVVDGSGNQLDAYQVFDASGNLKIVVPSGAKVNVGSAPQALAGGPAFAQVIQILITALGGNCVNGSQLTTAAAAIQALQQLTNVQTTELQGT